MLTYKNTFSILLVISLTACAIPEAQKRELSKTIKLDEAVLSLDSAAAPKALTEEFDTEIDLPVSKKFQFQICLKSSLESVSVSEKDLVILTNEIESKNLLADKHGCVQWEESVAMNSRAKSKDLEIHRQLEIKDKFKEPLKVSFLINPWDDKAELIRDTLTLDKASVETNIPDAYELGFESLSVKISKKSDSSMSLTLEGAPSINGKVLRHGKLKGDIIVMFSKDGKIFSDKKTLPVNASVRNGVLIVETQENIFNCAQGNMYLEIELAAVSKRHAVKNFKELHVLKACDQIEGSHNLNEAIKQTP